MTMHLVGPYLNMNGKKKGKQKFRNDEEARKARELAAEWEALQKKWEPKKNLKPAAQETLKLDLGNPRNVDIKSIPSKVTPGGSCSKKQPMQYTGTKMLGIGTMHKSNSVPIFSDQEAKDVSTMRR